MSVSDREIKRQQRRERREQKLVAFLVMLTVAIGIFMFLWFYVVAPHLSEDDGIEIAFGNENEGSSAKASKNFAVPTRSNITKTQDIFTDDDLLVQEDPSESLRKRPKKRAVVQQDPDALIAEQLRREEEERQRLLAEAQARKQAQEDQAIANATAMGSLFNETEGSGAEGGDSDEGVSQQGNPLGSGNVGSANWSLAGRSVHKLPPPSSNFNQEGRVVVTIQVNEEGRVVSANVGRGTTISDYGTRQIALTAARNARFSTSSTKMQVGTITYTFKFK